MPPQKRGFQAVAARETMGTNIEPSLVQRLAQGVRYIVSGVGPTNFFGPSQPLAPLAQEATQGRAFDYPVGFNLRIQPREGEAIGFADLRGIADGYDLLRLVIETRKDQIEAFDWEIVPAKKGDSATAYAADIKAVTDFLGSPDKEHSWPQWLRMQLEDLLVLDAIVIYPRATRGGDLYSLDLVDPATIKRVLDDGGRTPIPPSVAYQQVLKGIPTGDYSRDDLVYTMRNPRTNRIYGLSPVEQVLMTVNIALRRQLSQLDFYTQGNVPEALAQVPATWTSPQIKDFQTWWDSLMEGNSAQKRKMRFIPSLDKIVFPKDAVLKDEYDEWLARIVCFAFSISPSALIKQVNRASGEQMADTAKEEGLMPLLRFIESHLTTLVQRFMGATGLRFRFKVVNKVAPKEQAEIHKTYVDIEAMTPDEVREDLEMQPMTKEEREAAWPTPIPPGMNADGTPILPKGAPGAVPATNPAGGAPGVPPGETKPPKPEPTAAEKMLAEALAMLDPARQADALAKAIAALPAPAPQGDTFITVPQQPAPVVNVHGDTQVVAPPAPLMKRVTAGRDPATGKMVGEIELVGDHTASVVSITAALEKMR